MSKGWKGESHRHSIAKKGIRTKNNITKKIESAHAIINLQWHRVDIPIIRRTMKYWIKNGYTLYKSYIINYTSCLKENYYKLYISAKDKKGNVEKIILGYIPYENVAKEFKKEIDKIQLELQSDEKLIINNQMNRG